MSQDASTPTPPVELGAAPPAPQEPNQRDRMLAGMAQTIAQRGYRGATITEVVRFAKVSKRTFYEEFGDKESCFLELYELVATQLQALIVEKTDPASEDWRGQIALGARVYYTALAGQPLLTRAFFIEVATLSDRATKVRRQSFDAFAQTLVDLVEAAREAHAHIPSRPLTHMMAAAVLGGMTDVMIGAIERDEMDARLDELVETCTDLIATIVTGQFPPGQEI